VEGKATIWAITHAGSDGTCGVPWPISTGGLKFRTRSGRRDCRRTPPDRLRVVSGRDSRQGAVRQSGTSTHIDDWKPAVAPVIVFVDEIRANPSGSARNLSRIAPAAPKSLAS
jgi:hypothetical protein